MHFYVLLPMTALILAGVLAAAIAAREPNRQASRTLLIFLLLSASWSLCEVFWNLAADEPTALRYARWSTFGSLMLGPTAFHLLLTLDRGASRWLRRFLLPSYVVTLALAVVSATTDWVILAMHRTSWGWAPVVGPAIAVMYAGSACWVLGYLLHRIVTTPLEAVGATRHAAPLLVFAGACLLVASVTDFLLPMLGIYMPRLGSSTIVVFGAATGWWIYRSRETRFSPQQFAREILDALPHGVALVRLDDQIRAANARLGDLAECPADLLLGTPLTELLDASREQRTRSPEDLECDLLAASGDRVRVSVSRTELLDGEHQVIGHVYVVRDLREVVSLRSRLVTSGRLAAVGQLAAGIAHEINNPIAYVRSNFRMLERHWATVDDALAEGAREGPLSEALEEGPELLRESCEGIDRVAAIVRDVGGFSERAVAETELAAAGELMDTAVRVAAPQLRHTRVERCYAPVPMVPCVPRELMQVFLNLLLNASQSLPAGGRIDLSTEVEGDNVVVTVADDGPGIDPAVVARIFDPFFTTKPVGEGTGLGLSISLQIVRKLGGDIEVDTDLERGSAFRVILPHAARDAAGMEAG